MDPVVSNGVLAIVAALFRDDIVAMVATITRAECRVLQHLLAVVDVDGSSRDEHAQAREITTTPAVLISGGDCSPCPSASSGTSATGDPESAGDSGHAPAPVDDSLKQQTCLVGKDIGVVEPESAEPTNESRHTVVDVRSVPMDRSDEAAMAIGLSMTALAAGT
ncbi:Uncharacterized protein PBTT_05775 [Plasmodiophora brassicae]